MQKITNCAIGRDNSSGSCFNIDELKSIATDYNEKNSKNKIIITNNKEDMINKLKNVLQKECSDQTCWTTLKFIKNKEELQEAFKPNGPSGQFDWLSTTEINECMERYMNLYPDFLFLGAVPIDFDDLPSLGLATLNVNQLKNQGITKLGFIFNLDEHYKKGSHWVALYADTSKNEVRYFDSYGIICNARIRKLIRRIITQSCGKGKKATVGYNKIRHQFDGSECGVYSINFILRMLSGEKFEDICNSKVPDKEINKCRMTYFNNPNF
jgi:Ulp1 family protease